MNEQTAATVEERVARHLAAKEWLTTPDRWDQGSAWFRADYLAYAREVIAIVRATVLREAADELGRMDYDTDSNDYGYDTYRDAWNGGVMDGADKLRRLAGETQQAPCGRPASMATSPCSAGDHCCKGPSEAQQDPTQDDPRRGDQFEQWLTAQRDAHRDTGHGVWTTLDQLLDQYRQHADSGSPLGEHVCEGRAADETQQGTTQDGDARPPQHAWRVETRDPLANEWAPGSHFASRPHAVERYETANRTAPLWRDGTPVERRIVRETTTYTVEEPTAVARPGQPGTDEAEIRCPEAFWTGRPEKPHTWWQSERYPERQCPGVPGQFE